MGIEKIKEDEGLKNVATFWFIGIANMFRLLDKLELGGDKYVSAMDTHHMLLMVAQKHRRKR